MGILVLFLTSLLYLNFAFAKLLKNSINTTTTTKQPIKEVSDKDAAVWCRFQPNGYDCKDTGNFKEYYYFDTKLEDCKLFKFGTCKHEANRFNSLKECRSSCLSAGVRDISGKISARIYCKFQPEFGRCNDYYPKYYFDMTTRTCRGFSYSGCGGNVNRFSTIQICSSLCGSFMENVSQE